MDGAGQTARQRTVHGTGRPSDGAERTPRPLGVALTAVLTLGTARWTNATSTPRGRPVSARVHLRPTGRRVGAQSNAVSCVQRRPGLC